MKNIKITANKDLNDFKKGESIEVYIQKPTYGGLRVFPCDTRSLKKGINYGTVDKFLSDFNIDGAKVYNKETRQWGVDSISVEELNI